MAEQPEQQQVPELDPLDLQIIAIKADRPNTTIREIAELTKSTPTTVWRRLQKIGSSDWIKDARNECLALLPMAIAVYARRMGKGDDESLAAARDLLFGLGVLKKQHKYEHSGPGGGPIPIHNGPVFVLEDNGSALPIPDANGTPDPS